MSGSGLGALFRAIGSYLTANRVDARVLVGLKARSEWATSRIVLIPGFFDGSNTPRALDGGTMGAPVQKASVSPRELASWERAYTLSVYAVDLSNPQDEALQLFALEDLQEEGIRAVWNGIDPVSGRTPGAAGVEWVKTIYPQPPVVNAAGKEILLWFTLLQPFFDRKPGRATPTLSLGKQLGTDLGGAKASVAATSGSLATITGLINVQGDWLTQWLTFSGASSSGNVGSFQVVQVLGPAAVVVQNGSAVAPDANNGAISWSLSPVQPA